MSTWSNSNCPRMKVQFSLNMPESAKVGAKHKNFKFVRTGLLLPSKFIIKSFIHIKKNKTSSGPKQYLTILRHQIDCKIRKN